MDTTLLMHSRREFTSAVEEFFTPLLAVPPAERPVDCQLVTLPLLPRTAVCKPLPPPDTAEPLPPTFRLVHHVSILQPPGLAFSFSLSFTRIITLVTQ
jgi:hypothetical protein